MTHYWHNLLVVLVGIGWLASYFAVGFGIYEIVSPTPARWRWVLALFAGISVFVLTTAALASGLDFIRAAQ